MTQIRRFLKNLGVFLLSFCDFFGIIISSAATSFVIYIWG